MIDIKINDIRGMPAPRPRVTKAGNAYNLKVYTEYKEFLQLKMRGFKMLPNKPLRVELIFGFKAAKSVKKNKYPIPQGDLDNYAKGVLDAANKILFIDDTLVADLRVVKAYTETDFIMIRMEVI